MDAAEIWHWYAGAPLELSIWDGKGEADRLLLGPDLLGSALPQQIVPVHAWQSARSLGDWTLVGCTVSQVFEFAGFEMAPGGWTPGATPNT